MTTILTELQEIKNKLSALSINVQNGTNVNCGCPGGSVIESDGPVEGSEPPIGFVDPPDEFGTQEYDDRKCLLANILHDEVVASVDIWIVNEVDTTVQNFGRVSFAIAVGIIGALFGNTAIPILGGIAGGTIGLAAGIVAALLAPSVNLSTTKTALENNAENLVCALYQSASAIEGRFRYLQVLDDAGLSLTNQGVVAAILVTNFLNVLYFNPEGKEAELQSIMDGYGAPPVDCSTCPEEGGCERIYLWGQEVGATGTSLDAEGLNIQTQRPGCGNANEIRVGMSFSATFVNNCTQPTNCGEVHTMTSVSILSGAIQKSGGTAKLRFFGVTGTLLLSTDTVPWTGNIANVARIIIVSQPTSPFTVRANWSS